MRRISSVIIVLILVSGAAFAQEADSAYTYVAPEDPPPASKDSGPSRFYYGASLGFSFGDYTRISIAPLLGYRLSRKWSIGGRVAYEYIKDTRYEEDYTAHNYGGSLFGRYRPIPKLYLHGEYAYMSYDLWSADGSSNREWVPFLLLGGGYVQPISPRAAFFVEVLFDVLQDDMSPYEEWKPWISVGVSAGF
jgi:hypothetical protein